MSLHWWHVAISYVLVLGGFAALTATSVLRHAQARRVLGRLETRKRRSVPDGRGGAR